MNEVKSSFVKRTLSVQDYIIQVLRSRLQSRVVQAMDMLDRLTKDLSELTGLGETVTIDKVDYQITPEILKSTLDEFGELQAIVEKGRAMLNDIGYVSRQQNTPLAGKAPVGKPVNIIPITTKAPGREPLSGVVVQSVEGNEHKETP